MKKLLPLLCILLCFLCQNSFAANHYQILVNKHLKPLMTKYNITGMAVAITVAGKTYFYNYGVTSRETKTPVTNKTLFKLASVSKTFAATLIAELANQHKLSLYQHVDKYLPRLKDSELGQATLVELLTHTSGLPLSAPDITNQATLFHYYEKWQPSYPMGTRRQYSNLGIGLTGFIAQNAAHQSYATLVNQDILRPLHMQHTYFDIPSSATRFNAVGYNTAGKAAQMNELTTPMPASDGLVSNTQDLIKYVQANIAASHSKTPLGKAMYLAQAGFVKLPYFQQDLVWDQYSFPINIKFLKNGNSHKIWGNAIVAHWLPHPVFDANDAYLNKTGSFNGYFSSYIAFVPAKKVGIVILANGNIPTPQRAAAAYHVIEGIIAQEIAIRTYGANNLQYP